MLTSAGHCAARFASVPPTPKATPRTCPGPPRSVKRAWRSSSPIGRTSSIRGARHDEADLGVAHAERTEPRHLRGELVAERLGADDGVDLLDASGRLGRENLAAVGAEALAKAFEMLALDLEAGGGAVAAEARKLR